jgi:[acyl-carrier-protein] S-malonyltransferase
MTKKFAFICPGQGSQHLAMLEDLANHFPAVKSLYQQASEILNYDLWRLVSDGPVEELNQTERTQPALLVAGFAVWQLWQELGGSAPSFLAGHSLGEYTALVCAGAIDFEDAVTLVAARGRYMQEAVPEGTGAMAAIIGLTNEQVMQVCDQASQNPLEVTPANFNSIGQIVIAGQAPAIERAILLAKEFGAKLAKRLPMSVPSHCELMRPAAGRLQEKLTTIAMRHPNIPVINNVDVQSYQEPELMKDALVRQLYSPVRWIEIIQVLANNGIETFVESGPNKVLTGLNKRIVSDSNCLAITDLASLQDALRLTQQVSVEY